MKLSPQNTRLFFLTAVFFCASAGAWGPEGHRAVGALALDHMDDHQKVLLQQIMGTTNRDDLTQWCNWPDDYRDTDEGEWTEPLHYINMVEGEHLYDKPRDCDDGLCVTEAITRFAAELGDVTLSDHRRQQAFGFVCHFVGDLSQTLHAGFGHDRGGNDFEIEYQGEESNLHEFWDHTLIEEHAGTWENLYRIVHQQPFNISGHSWQASEVIQWTNSSHAIAMERAYPEGPEISDEFATQSWEMIQAQLLVGGTNLTRVLNTVLDNRQ